MQRIFKCDNIQNTTVTPDELNILMYRLHFCVIIYRSNKLLKMVQLLVHTVLYH